MPYQNFRCLCSFLWEWLCKVVDCLLYISCADLKHRLLVCSKEWLATGRSFSFVAVISWLQGTCRTAECTLGVCRNSSAKQMPGETLRADPQSANGRHTKPEAVAQLVPCMVLFKALHHPGILWCLLIHVCHAEWRHYFARASELWEYLISKFRSVKWIFGIGNKQLTEESFKQSWHLFPQRLRA